MSDLDGTLLNRQRAISERTARVLRTAEARGIRVVLATGRFFRDVVPVAETAGIRPSFILMNGAEIRDADGNLQAAINLAAADYRETMRMFREDGFTPEIYTSAGEFLCADEATSLREMHLRMRIMHSGQAFSDTMLRALPRFRARHYITDVEDLPRADVTVRKVICFCEDTVRIAKWKRQLTAMPQVIGLSSSIYNLEVTDRTAQKGIILSDYIRREGIAPEEVIVFGDGENDLSLFERFPLSAAPENALPLIRERARFHIGHHDRDGVAAFIEEKIL